MPSGGDVLVACGLDVPLCHATFALLGVCEAGEVGCSLARLVEGRRLLFCRTHPITSAAEASIASSPEGTGKLLVISLNTSFRLLTSTTKWRGR